MAISSLTPSRLSGLARRLVQAGLLSDEAALRAQEEATGNRQPLVAHLYEQKLVGPRELARLVAEEFGAPLIDLSAMDPHAMPVRSVDEKLLRRHQVLPIFQRGPRLYVAISDPTNQQALDDIGFATRKQIVAIIAEHTQLLEILEKMLDAYDTRLSALADADLEAMQVSQVSRLMRAAREFCDRDNEVMAAIRLETARAIIEVVRPPAPPGGELIEDELADE